MSLPAPGSTVPGRGAWTKGGHATGRDYYVWLWYWYNDGFDPEKSYSHRAVHLGVCGIQQMLLLTGGTVKVSGKYDQQTAKAVKAFQAGRSLKADGVYGPATAQKLTRVLITFMANHHDVPPEIIWGFTALESGFDPAAVGVVNGYDSGLCQINLEPAAHGNQVTPEMAFNPYFNIDYTCRRFKAALAKFDDKGPALQLDCAIIQHNSPKAAQEIYEVGWVGPDEKAGIYLALVKSRAETY